MLFRSSIPSNRLSSLQSCWEYFAANSTWLYTKLTGVSFPSVPIGPTSAMWFGSALVYRVFTMAQASLAPCRQADIFHYWKRRRAPLSISTSSPCLLAGRRMATRPGQCPASPAELVRAVVRARQKTTCRPGHFLCGTTRQHTYRYNSVSRFLRQTPYKVRSSTY